MRYKNNGPVTLYVVVDVEYGNVMHTSMNKADARAYLHRWSEDDMVLLTYDQRGTR